MREIKFRAWDSKRKIMPYSDNFTDPSPIKKLSAFFHWIHDLDAIELMQYTGLHDKNGKEIYEGDLIKTNVYRKLEIVEVAWGYGKWWIREPKEKRWYPTTKHIAYMEQGEVLGNIYEHSYLLDMKAGKESKNDRPTKAASPRRRYTTPGIYPGKSQERKGIRGMAECSPGHLSL